MEAGSLYDLIQCIEYGTRLHIGVLFFHNYASPMCTLPYSHQIHKSPVCDSFKAVSQSSYSRCVRCRNFVIKKVLTTKAPLDGLCVNGIYEYTHPVLVGEDVAAIIFIGNILDREKGMAKICRNAKGGEIPLDTLEPDFSPQMCKNVAGTIDRYIRFLLEQYPDEAPEEKPLIQNIKTYIESNLEFGISVHNIAEAFHYNARYICRLFKKETGILLGEYLLVRRLERAKYLLRETTLSVLEISTEIGFNNVTYFNKLFKTAFGTTPTAYRKEKGKNGKKE